MGKRKVYKIDDTGVSVEDKDAEALEQDDPTLDDEGNPIAPSSKDDEALPAPAMADADKKDVSGTVEGSTDATDNVAKIEAPASAPAATDVAQDADVGAGQSEAPADTKQGDTVDTADLTAKAPELGGMGATDKDAGKSQSATPGSDTSASTTSASDTSDSSAKAESSAQGGDAGKPDDQAQTAPGDASAASSAAQSTVESSESPADKPAETETETESATDKSDAGDGEDEAEEDESPKDPATLPGMAPTQAVGQNEALGGMAVPVTAIDGVAKGDDVPALDEPHDAAQPIVEALGDNLNGELKDAGNTLTNILHKLKEAEPDLSKLGDEARGIIGHLRNMGAHCVAAFESIFKRK